MLQMRLDDLHASSRDTAFSRSLQIFLRGWHVGHGLRCKNKQSSVVQRNYKRKDKRKIAGRMMRMQRMTMRLKPTTLRKKKTDYTGSGRKRSLSFIL
jgi:hypothetical protein